MNTDSGGRPGSNSSHIRTRPTSLVFGAGGLHRLAFAKRRQALLRQAFDLGFRSFDVAPAYGNGLNEVELGAAFSTHRGDIKITTKFGIPIETYGERFRASFALVRASRKYFYRGYGSEYSRRLFSGPAMVESLHGSLRRLRCDYVDRLLIHEPLESFSSEIAIELSEFAARLKAQGKVLSFGVCGPADSVLHAISSMPMDVVQTPLWDAVSLAQPSSQRFVAYGVYRDFRRQAGALRQEFVDYVSTLQATRPNLELILASVSQKTLLRWQVLFQ